MSNRIIRVPEPVRQRAATSGTEGLRWLVGLGDLIEELEREWQLIVEESLEGGLRGVRCSSQDSGWFRGHPESRHSRN